MSISIKHNERYFFKFTINIGLPRTVVLRSFLYIRHPLRAFFTLCKLLARFERLVGLLTLVNFFFANSFSFFIRRVRHPTSLIERKQIVICCYLKVSAIMA